MGKSRQLSWIYAEDEFELSFTYNDEGIRTSKNSSGTVHYYTLAGDMILSEEWMAGTTQYLLLYHYDANGQPIGMSYRRSTDYEAIMVSIKATSLKIFTVKKYTLIHFI